MSYAAITYRVKPGSAAEIRKIFAEYQRASSPILRNEQGERVGLLLGTALFVKDDTVVRVIHFEGGTVEDVARHMSTQPGTREAERRMAPYVAVPRDTETPEGFLEYFRNSRMELLSELTIPAEFLAARAGRP